MQHLIHALYSFGASLGVEQLVLEPAPFWGVGRGEDMEERLALRGQQLLQVEGQRVSGFLSYCISTSMYATFNG